MTASRNGNGNGNGHGSDKPPPPAFEDGRNRRQRARAAGLDPNYWYAVYDDTKLAPGEVVEVKFQGESVALYRDETGVPRVLANRCAHRQVKLSTGVVEGENLICQYHGWKYDKTGALCGFPHEDFGRGLPRCSVPTYPVKVRYGLIWIFFGDPALADQVSLPHIPELEGPDRWASLLLDYTWNAHYSMIVENICDFTHEFLHRKTKPFEGAKLRKLEKEEDRILMAYDTRVASGDLTQYFIDRDNVRADYMELGFEYPYQWSNTGDHIKHWCFMLPMDERTTRCFFLFYFMSFKVPFLPITIPRWLTEPMLKLSKPLYFDTVMAEDGLAVEWEQYGWDNHWHTPMTELSPVVHAMQDLAIRKWEEHLARSGGDPRKGRSGSSGNEPSPSA